MFGRCYHYALETLFDLHTNLSSGTVVVSQNGADFDLGGHATSPTSLPELGDFPVLVHGFVVGHSDELKGIKFGHAWLEGNGMVLDCGSEKKWHSLTPREEYYAIWQVNSEECHRYSLKQAVQHVVATGSVSGWHAAPADAITVEIRNRIVGQGAQPAVHNAPEQGGAGATWVRWTP